MYKTYIYLFIRVSKAFWGLSTISNKETSKSLQREDMFLFVRFGYQFGSQIKTHKIYVYDMCHTMLS